MEKKATSDPNVARTQTSAPLQPRIFAKLTPPEHFHGSMSRSGLRKSELCPLNMSRRNQKTYRKRCNSNRVACMKSICESQLARGKDRTISVISTASLPAKFADFPSLCCQVGLEKSKSWRYIFFYDCTARNCIAWQLRCGPERNHMTPYRQICGL